MEEVWQLKIEAADFAKKLPVEPIQSPTVGKLQPILSTDPVREESQKDLGANPH